MISGLSALSAAVVLAAAGGEGSAPAPARQARGDPSFEAEYLHSLSTNFGKLPLSGVGLSYDPVQRELFVVGDGGPIRVFNESGMEVYSFRDSPELAAVAAIAATENGDLVALGSRRGGWALLRFTFRGEPIAEIVPRNLPAALAGFVPSHMRYARGRIYLCDGPTMRILVLDEHGEHLASYDVAEKLGEAQNRAELGIRGFGVDGEGNLLFTIQPLFRAYTMTPDGEVTGFGQRGSAPGKFNVVGGIARDAAGNYYVADLLKSAILVFNPDRRFVKEFGYRGRMPESLAVPDDIVVGGDKLYVSNRGRRGVSVFHVGAP